MENTTQNNNNNKIDDFLNFLMMQLLFFVFILSCLNIKAQEINPTEPTQGFDLFVKESAILKGGHSEGVAAIGGNAIFDYNYSFAHDVDGGFMDNNNQETTQIGLYVDEQIILRNVNGDININSNTYLKIGNTDGLYIHDVMPNNPSQTINTRINQSSNNIDSNPKIILNVKQPESSINRKGLINFEEAFTVLESYSNQMSQMESTTDIEISSGTGIITLQEGVNVINLTGDDINNISALQFNNGNPNTDKIVIFNINTTTSYSTEMFNFNGLGDQDGQYILFNFYNTDNLEFTNNGKTVKGTIYAPKANFIKNSSSNIDGQVIVKSFEMSNGELHHQTFDHKITPNLISESNQPFNCVYNAYLFQYNDVYAVNLASGTSLLVAENITSNTINASAYNNVDGYLWGFLNNEPKTLVRIGNDFSTNKFKINTIPDGINFSFVGDINKDGVYHFKDDQTVYKVDLNPNSENYLKYIGSFNLSSDINVHDWAFNINDNHLYTVEKNTNHLYRINTSALTMEDLGEVPILKGNSYTYGAVYFDVDGNFYISANQTGTIYRIKNVQDIITKDNINSNLFAYGPASASNDGARCPSAPVPDEDCSNNIDDDGDGLVDCDDPACSGVEECPTITLTTSGNSGGLESNNRLSQKINSRNYTRSKTNYKFDSKKAPSYKKINQNYLGQKIKTSIEDFIPYDGVENTEAIVTTPSDLIGLTNAIKTFSVDYVNQNKQTVASILSMETENGVYEHTKYICDRLLGAEILGINTFFINEEMFIKTTIKNTGGEIEHVISFAVNDNGDGYNVESHWNLDQYTADKSYYNFQIWSNSVDDLYKLTNNVLEMFNNVKPITSYKNSRIPYVYIKSGNYKNGKLTLNIVNTNNSTSINIKGGLRASETSDTEIIDTKIQLNKYNTNIEFEAKSLFDFGFRIESNKGGTPDDVFMADGAWGLDDSAENTKILNFEVNPQEDIITEGSYMVERNINLSAKTTEYVSIYKAFTPRFNPINLQEYNALKLNLKGNGKLSIVIMKDNITKWEDQHKYTLELNNEMEIKEISLNEFKNQNNESINMSNVTMIVFLIANEVIGAEEEKSISIQNIEFKHNNTLSNNEIVLNKQAQVTPNPIKTNTVIKYDSKVNTDYQLSVFDASGKKIKYIKGTVVVGNNAINYTRTIENNGVYLYQLNITNGNSYSGKLIFID